ELVAVLFGTSFDCAITGRSMGTAQTQDASPYLYLRRYGSCLCRSNLDLGALFFSCGLRLISLARAGHALLVALAANSRNAWSWRGAVDPSSSVRYDSAASSGSGLSRLHGARMASWG